MPGISVVSNTLQVIASMKAKAAKVDAGMAKVAKQMAQTATQEVQQVITEQGHVVSETWRGSWYPLVEKKGDCRYEVGTYSKGAFNAGYNYGSLNEARYHSGEIGFHQALPEMTNLWQSAFSGGLVG